MTSIFKLRTQSLLNLKESPTLKLLSNVTSPLLIGLDGIKLNVRKKDLLKSTGAFEFIEQRKGLLNELMALDLNNLKHFVDVFKIFYSFHRLRADLRRFHNYEISKYNIDETQKHKLGESIHQLSKQIVDENVGIGDTFLPDWLKKLMCAYENTPSQSNKNVFNAGIVDMAVFGLRTIYLHQNTGEQLTNDTSHENNVDFLNTILGLLKDMPEIISLETEFKSQKKLFTVDFEGLSGKNALENARGAVKLYFQKLGIILTTRGEYASLTTLEG